ncbi:putative RING-H2 finger protein ATL69 [Phoenix dactylifera]|uniref:RING-H2 finger protein ATL69 n=1 Tax=Phoenix dactylifera TaxID=42345 RepID=A0A8B7BZL0_PHODC|nr:putative RING-H2 finger protein ATL69 [Phoenix dactylifera]
MSANSLSAPLPSSPSSAADVGLGYGIAIAVGLLVLVSTIMLASYVCVRVKGSGDGPRSSAASSSSPSAAAHGDSSDGGNPSDAAAFVGVGLDGPAIEAYYPKFVHKFGGGAAAPAGPCPICLAEYEGGEALRRVPECGHCFHAACVDEWLRVSATCPLCRSSPVPSVAATPVATPLSELIPLAVHAR